MAGVAHAKAVDLLGQSRAMEAVRALLERVAPSDLGVLITGETGTGKELVARALHALGPRSVGPFVAINCAALPETLLEAELFGHARGAFTDAREPRRGLFLEADGGTLFFDELGEMALGMQAKLLRALEERKVRPVGSDKEVGFDARVIAATNKDLEAAVEEGRFREDLYFRIQVVQVEVPPLRERAGDILVLAEHFLGEIAARSEAEPKRISRDAAGKLVAYRWPGNVRELRNAMERAAALAAGQEILDEDLPQRIRDHQPSHVLVAADHPTELVTLAEVERRYIERVLEAVGGRRQEAARILGLDRKTLYRKLESWRQD